MEITEHADYFSLLGVAHHATTADIRRSYRAALLRVHPDKHTLHNQGRVAPTAVISQLQEALRTLSDPELRADYERSLKQGKGKFVPTAVIQRPAHEISLDEFDIDEVEGAHGDIVTRWRYSCRCGGIFMIGEQQLEQGVHYVGCNGCSEVVWVGYEEIDESE